VRLPRPTDGDFTPVPAGSFPAICYRVIDLGTQTSSFNGDEKEQHKVMLSFELKDDDCVMPDKRPMTIHQRYTWSMHEKATLRKHLEAWRAKAFTDADFGDNGFDIRNLLGVPCLLSIVHNTKGDRTYSNISSIAKLPKGMNVGALHNDKVFLSLEDEEFDRNMFAKLPDGIRSTIMDSPEYQRLAANGGGSEGGRGYAQDDNEIPF
jgi:hypothetical protein